MSDHCFDCIIRESHLAQFADWLLEQEAGHAEQHLKLSRMVNMQPQAQTANTISLTYTHALETFDRFFPAEKARTAGLWPTVRAFLFGY